MRQRLQTFFYSRKNLAGLVLAFGGLTLYAFGILTFPAWIPITAGLYALGYLLMPTKTAGPTTTEAPADEVDLRDDLTTFLHGLRGKVADDLYAKAWSIRKSIVTILAVEGQQDVADPNVYLIRQTAQRYLPDAFATYLRVPRVIAESRPLANGRTPHDVLLDQLELMDQRLAEVSDAIVRHDSDKLLANGRFLAEKFGTSSFQLPVDAAEVPAVDLAETPSDVTMAQPAKVDEQVEQRERVH